MPQPTACEPLPGEASQHGQTRPSSGCSTSPFVAREGEAGPLDLAGIGWPGKTTGADHLAATGLSA